MSTIKIILRIRMKTIQKNSNKITLFFLLNNPISKIPCLFRKSKSQEWNQILTKSDLNKTVWNSIMFLGIAKDRIQMFLKLLINLMRVRIKAKKIN